MSKHDTTARRLVEIRAYRLNPGTRADFHVAASERALPMVRAYGMDVVAHGPVPNDENGYFLRGPARGAGVAHRDLRRHPLVAEPGRDRRLARRQRGSRLGDLIRRRGTARRHARQAAGALARAGITLRALAAGAPFSLPSCPGRLRAPGVRRVPGHRASRQGRQPPASMPYLPSCAFFRVRVGASRTRNSVSPWSPFDDGSYHTRKEDSDKRVGVKAGASRVKSP